MDFLTLELIRQKSESWGFHICGESPVSIQEVQPDSPAEEAGLQVDDVIVAVNGFEVIESNHNDVVDLIRSSRQIMRLKIQPSTQKSNKTAMTSSSSSWFDDSTSHDDVTTTSSSDDDDVITSLEEFCQLLKELPDETRPRYDDVTGDVEQSVFCITKQQQKDFDLRHQQNTFQGHNAVVAGAFSGDYNVVRETKSREIRGVVNRVKAGVQHFGHQELQEKDLRNKIVIYTTSLGVNRLIRSECENSIKIIRGFRVKFEVKTNHEISKN